MADLRDGEAIEVQGSGARSYTLKNSAGVFSCNCPGWRFQARPIERRTCSHLRKWRGDAAEAARIGGSLTATREPKSEAKAPPVMLAETWNGVLDPTGYWMSEKLDGVRAFWTGTHFLSRQGNRYFAPSWFTEGLPLEPLDGELWIGRKQFQRTVSIVRRHDGTDLWNEVRFVVFDAPAHAGPFESRLQVVQSVIEICRPPFALAHPQRICPGIHQMREELKRIESLGGEGLMLREPRSIYVPGRSATLLKVKSFKEVDARVIGHLPGAGRHRGRLGALMLELANGIRFAVGTGFSDDERAKPPPSGSIVTVRYQELSDAGVPRFGSFVRVRSDVFDIPQTQQKGEAVMPVSKRRFEFREDKSDKFWEIEVRGHEVVVCFGRQGTDGQRVTKMFGDNGSADHHAEKLIQQKVRKGYQEA